MIKIICEGIPIGFFSSKEDAQEALKYIKSGFIKEE